METRCGNVVLLGEPNVGKSSIVNAVVGEAVSIVTDLAGTTRTQIRGVKTVGNAQIIFLDTPGMVGAKRNLLDKSLSKSISGAVADADIILYVLDATDIKAEHIQKIKNYSDQRKPLIVAVNKVDRVKMENLYPKLADLNKLSFVEAIVPLSAKSMFNIDVLESELVKHLPHGEFQFETDDYTDQPMRAMATEIIRGELVKRLHAELPHGIAVRIATWNEQSRSLAIHAEIICDKPSHKPIIIGKKGSVLKEVGIAARIALEELTQKHVRLTTHVLVRESWREKKALVDELV